MFALLSILWGCSGAGSSPTDDTAGLTHPGEDVGGFDTASFALETFLDGAELDGCGWLNLTGETRSAGRDWFVVAQLDPLGLDADAEGPLSLEEELREGWYLSFLDMTPGPTGLSGRWCDGSSETIDGYLYMALSATVSLTAERTVSPTCGDDSAWAVELRYLDADVLCIWCTVALANPVDIGPLYAVVETDPCEG